MSSFLWGAEKLISETGIQVELLWPEEPGLEEVGTGRRPCLLGSTQGWAWYSKPFYTYIVLRRGTVMAPPTYIHQKEDSWEKNTRTIRNIKTPSYPIEGNSRPTRQRPEAVHLPGSILSQVTEWAWLHKMDTMADTLLRLGSLQICIERSLQRAEEQRSSCQN